MTSLSILISHYEAAMKHLVIVEKYGDAAAVNATLATCQELRGAIEDLMPKDFCDPMANNRVAFIKVR